jgi:lipoprotein-releasing system ATP-binding protein
MEAIIDARGIRKSFGTLEVLKGIDFHADPREVVAIVGPSGAGKSTLLQILGTLSAPDAGSLYIDGTDVLSLKGDALASFRGRRIGFVFQAHHLLPEFTARENVMIPALIAGASMKDARARAERLLGEMGLEGRLDHKPSELSGGEQQRVAIARALVDEPAVLFADEPTGNLDSVTKQEIHRLFFDLRDKLGQTIVIVTHDPELAALCDRTLTMKDGRFI